MRVARALLTGVAVASVLVTVACTSDSSDPNPPAPTTSSASAQPDKLTFGVVGPRDVQRAFRATVDAWNLNPANVDVQIKSWPTQAAMRTAIEDGTPVPDVFLSSRADLAWLLDHKYTQPVDELLDERGVQFGDSYSRDALEAFSTDDHLQCMPYGVSPEVIYYNKRLVDFDRMRARGLNAPADDATTWSFDQFAAAAQFASRPARGTKGVHITPTIEGLTPFIRSGGGTVFDDPDQPTTMTFGSDSSKSALERTLELLRNPQVTLDESQLEQATALRWFLRGKLGMIAGDRSLTPVLRDRSTLDFDVLPMPRLGSAATVGDVTGLCLSATTSSTSLAADFMVHELAPDWVGLVANTGYLQPANVEVSLSDDFLQPGRQPEHAAIFNSSVRSMAVPPLIDTLVQLEETVAPSLRELVYGVGALDLDAVTSEIDAESKTVLQPPSGSTSPSASPSSSPSASASSSG